MARISPLLGPPYPFVPDVLGEWFLARRIASGTTTSTYLALPAADGMAGAPIVLRTLHPHLARDGSIVERFLDAARISARFAHPNLRRARAFGLVSGIPYCTMDHVQGVTWKSVLLAHSSRRDGRARTSFARIAAQVVADAAAGLHHAHELCDERGTGLSLVHREVSPVNLLVSLEGDTHVASFPIAREELRPFDTPIGSTKGVHGYMAPEQLRAAVVDRRADVFGLGVVLWETVTLRHLFARTSPDLTVLATLAGVVPALDALVPGIDPAFAAITARALARRPEDRYPTAAGLEEDLRAFLARTGPVDARPEVASFVARAVPTSASRARELVARARAAWADYARAGERGQRTISEVVARPIEGEEPIVPRILARVGARARSRPSAARTLDDAPRGRSSRTRS